MKMRTNTHIKTYKRFGTYDLDAVFPFVTGTPKKGTKNLFSRKRYGNFSIRMTSLRYHVFKHKGTVCVTCGVQGTFFALEKHRKDNSIIPHFNLYGVRPNGHEAMLTIDHIIPKSKGGKNRWNNLQPMCQKCNMKKGNNAIN